MTLLHIQALDSQHLVLGQEIRKEQGSAVHTGTYKEMDVEIKVRSCRTSRRSTNAEPDLIANEIEILTRLCHPGVAMLRWGSAGSCEAAFLIREPATCGNLQDLLIQRRGTTASAVHDATWADRALGLTIELMHALCYIHEVSSYETSNFICKASRVSHRCLIHSHYILPMSPHSSKPSTSPIHTWSCTFVIRGTLLRAAGEKNHKAFRANQRCLISSSPLHRQSLSQKHLYDQFSTTVTYLIAAAGLRGPPRSLPGTHRHHRRRRPPTHSLRIRPARSMLRQSHCRRAARPRQAAGGPFSKAMAAARISRALAAVSSDHDLVSGSFASGNEEAGSGGRIDDGGEGGGGNGGGEAGSGAGGGGGGRDGPD